ncbi:MAG: lipocalin family protein [Candidatus Binatia bacterium]
MLNGNRAQPPGERQPCESLEEAESGANYPMKWEVSIPSEGIELEILPAFPDQELITNRSTPVTCWEGSDRYHGHLQANTGCRTRLCRDDRVRGEADAMNAAIALYC